jgi:1-deoxyxylulose-5-phosphate synthase
MLPLCRAEGVVVIPWSPMARGRLTRNWDETSERQETDEFGKTLYTKTFEADRAVVERLAAVAKSKGAHRTQVALAWVLQKQGSRRRSSAPRSLRISMTRSRACR